MIPGRLLHRREFTPVPSLSSVFVYMISPKKVMLGASHTGVSSLRLLHRSENFVPARNIATVSYKRRTTTRSGVKLACVPFLIDAIFAIWIHACILSICGVPSGKHDTNSPRHHVNEVSRSHPGVKLASVRVFSCKHLLTLLYHKGVVTLCTFLV